MLNGGGVGEYLYSIKEDDEEQPLSPQKQSLDEVGSSDPGVLKPRAFGTILPSLGLIRVINNNATDEGEEEEPTDKVIMSTNNRPKAESDRRVS